MNLQEILPLIENSEIGKLRDTLATHCLVKDIDVALKQYLPKGHDVMDRAKRPDIIIKDEDGNLSDTVKVTRIPLAIQKKIVKTAVQFLGSPELISTPKEAIEEKMDAGIRMVWEDNKMDYKFKEVVRRAMSEYNSAMLWYTQDADSDYWEGTNINSKFKLRLKILSPKLGDDLYPVFDDFGDMVAFGRGYKIKRDSKEVEYFDFETATNIYYSSNETGDWVTKTVVNTIGKIRYIYFQSPLPWEDVEILISTVEDIVSDHNMTNKKIGSPIIFAEGQVQGFPKMGETGKVLIGESGAKVSYLTWNSAPESIKMEMENLIKFIYSLSSTPDISFENLKNLGYFSTAAFKAFFIDAHMNAADNETIFGEGAQRMINYQKTALSKFDQSLKPAVKMKIKPKFTYFLPKNDVEEIDNINKAISGGILSTETAVKLNPLVSDPDAEMEAIKAETTVNDTKAMEKIKASKPSLLPEPITN